MGAFAAQVWPVGEPPLPDLSRIYETFHARVVAYAARLLGPGDAEDVAQEVFIKVGRALDTLADASKLGAWIYAITRNAIRDAARKRCSRPEGAPATPFSSDGSEDEPAIARVPDTRSRTAEEALARNEMVACYLDYVERLPAAYHDVYALSEFDELTDREIAERLSVSLGTVKVRLHRARARLHEQLRRNCQCYRNERGELMGEPKAR